MWIVFSLLGLIFFVIASIVFMFGVPIDNTIKSLSLLLMIASMMFFILSIILY